MTASQHRELASGRWWSLSVAEQFGNIGSEISRAATWSTRHPQRAEAALHRALELIDLTLDDPRHRASVARLREVVLDFFAGPNQYGSSAASLQKYFDAYALAVRRT